jgi:hypothetical protein
MKFALRGDKYYSINDNGLVDLSRVFSIAEVVSNAQKLFFKDIKIGEKFECFGEVFGYDCPAMCECIKDTEETARELGTVRRVNINSNTEIFALISNE